MNLYIAADHRGFQLKDYLKTHYPQLIDLGATHLDPQDDYPDLAHAACSRLTTTDKAILICGSGHGMDITANRYPHIRAILGFNHQVVEQGRAHEDANVLVLPADWLSFKQALACVHAFLTTSFSGEPRHLRRLEKLNNLKAV